MDRILQPFYLGSKVRQHISYNKKTSVLFLIQDKMFFILVYLKTNPLQELHAIQFEMTQAQDYRWIHLLSEILWRTLKTLDELPNRNSKRLIHNIQDYEEVLLDGAEQPIQCPVDEDRQPACYSGKKLIA